MPNVKIFGMPFDEGTKLRSRILDLLKDAPYRDLVVVTCISSIVEDSRDNPAPYLEVVASHEAAKEVSDIQKRLDDLDMDVELPPPVRFVERRSMREAAHSAHPSGSEGDFKRLSRLDELDEPRTPAEVEGVWPQER